MKKILPSFFAALLLSSLLPALPALAFTGPTGGNSFPDATYSWDDDGFSGFGFYYDNTSKATDTTDSLTIFTDLDDALYIGFSDPFDGVSMTIDTSVQGDSSMDFSGTRSGVYKFQYWDGSAWSDLDDGGLMMISSDYNIENGSNGAFVEQWDRPSDWDKVSVSTGADYYYVRLLITEAYAAGNATASQVSVIDYNLVEGVRDVGGNLLTGLSQDDFELTALDSSYDDTVYTFKELNDGEYGFAVDAPLDSHHEYDFRFVGDGYISVDLETNLDLDRSMATSSTRAVEYAYVAQLENVSGTAISGATVLAGDDLSVTCVDLGGGDYGCPVPVADTSRAIRVTASSYDVLDSTFSSDRDSQSDGQVAQSFTLTTAVDTDADGLSDGDEVSLGTDPNNEDSDNDGIFDGAEVTDGTDPLDANDYLADGNDYYLSCTDPFTDTYGHWAKKSICLLYDAGVVAGRSATTYEPNAEITRAEFTKIALLNAGFVVPNDYVVTSSTAFTDVDAGEWYAPYIAYAQDHNFVDGYSDGTFHPNANINRAEAVTILLRVAGETRSSSGSSFTDVSSSAWYSDAVELAADEGLVQGYSDGTFRPGNSITRAEVAVIARRAWYVYFE